jgi:hypothetical protein
MASCREYPLPGVSAHSSSKGGSIREVRWSGGGFGLSVISDYPLLAPIRESRCGDILELRRLGIDDPALQIRSDGERVLWSARFPDGADVEVTEGAEGEHRIAYGEHAVFVLSPDRRHVDWSASSEGEATVQRFLLDTVLWWTSMSLDFDLLHASAVKLPEGVVAVVGKSGAGKTSVAIELMERGGALYSDDVLAIRRLGSEVVVYPGPALMNVPRRLLSSMSGRGCEIALFAEQDETWMSVEHAADGPEPLGAVFVLDRQGQGEPRIERIDPSPFTLMTHAWGLKSAGPRAQQSFENYAEMARATPAYRLSAGSDASPAMIAELVWSAQANPMYANCR